MLSALIVAGLTMAQATGLDLPLQVSSNDPILPEDAVTRMACTYTGKTYHYDVYLPLGYYAAANSQYPVVFIASPGGNATMGNAEGWIRSHRWLAVMLVEARNGPSEPNNENFLCAHDDVIQRVRVHASMKFATGFSGAARMSARFVTYRPGFRGLILQGAGMCSNSFCIEWFLANTPTLCTSAAFGNTDPNLWELNYLRATMPAAKFNYEIFAGGHQEAPVDTMNRAFTWLVAKTVEKVTPVITWANPAAIAYGTALGPTQLNATASVAGTFVYSPTAGTVLAVGTHTLSTTFTPADTATYATATKAVTIGVLPFTDNPLTRESTMVKAVHVTELRQPIDALRARFNLGAFAWTDASIVVGVTRVRAVHVTDLRTALNAVYVAAGRAAPTYTHTTVTGGTTVITAVDIAELRAAILAIW